MSRRRKLIKREALKACALRNRDGVPITRLIDDYELDISAPKVAELIAWFNEGFSAALFPRWLDKADSNVGESPDTYEFIGDFPNGSWKKCKQSNPSSN